MKEDRKTAARYRARGQQKYYLQQERQSDRLFLDSERSRKAIEVATTLASSWLDAKRRLGFTLTPLQEVLLAKQNRHPGGASDCFEALNKRMPQPTCVERI